MLKKLRSRRGFTLIEVLIAFVIFAIMAAMVALILQQTQRARQENLKIERELTSQVDNYYQKEHKADAKTYADNVAAGRYAGTATLNFGGTNSLSMDYVAVDPTGTDDNLELEYFVGKNGNDYWTTAKEQTVQNNDKNGGSVMGSLDPGIYGSAGIDDVQVGVEKRIVDGNTRYYVYVYPTTTTLSGESLRYYAQLRMKFPYDITAFGYCDNSKGEDTTSTWNCSVDINIPGNTQTIRLSGDGKGSKSIFDVREGLPTFWVTLNGTLSDEQLSDMTKIFGNSGDKGTVVAGTKTGKDGSVVHSAKFGRYMEEVDDTENPGTKTTKTYVNVFAATKTEKEDTP